MEKKIIIKAGSRGHELIKSIKENKEATTKRMMERMPPKIIRDEIEKMVVKTARINEGRLNESDFRLGMYAMWSVLYSKKMIATKPI